MISTSLLIANFSLSLHVQRSQWILPAMFSRLQLNTGCQEPTENGLTTQDKHKTDDTRLQYGSMSTVCTNSLSVRHSCIPMVKPRCNCCLFFSLNLIPTDCQIFRLFFCLQPIISRLLDFHNTRIALQENFNDITGHCNQVFLELIACLQKWSEGMILMFKDLWHHALGIQFRFKVDSNVLQEWVCTFNMPIAMINNLSLSCSSVNDEGIIYSPAHCGRDSGRAH